jgi:hypothetical protein
MISKILKVKSGNQVRKGLLASWYQDIERSIYMIRYMFDEKKLV